MLDPVEVVDCIEALSKVAELQSAHMARLEKDAAEKGAELERALDILGSTSVDEYLSKQAREDKPQPKMVSLGKADPKWTKPRGMRESEYRLRQHFGLIAK